MPLVIGADPFIGREREMAELTAALDSALEGRGGLVMLAGEPGIGKTRLTEELESIALDRGALVTRGASYEGGGVPPFWPWSQIIRSLLTGPSQTAMVGLDVRTSIIAEIIPEIKDALPDPQPVPEVEPAQARFRLFDSVTSFLINAASSHPVVLVLDDLHWADRSSLDMLEFVARDIATHPILVIGGYRDTELSRRHPLSETLAVLARNRAFRRIPLRGLERDEVGRLVEAAGITKPPPALIKDIHDRTEGNPFFVAEVARDLAREAVGPGEYFGSGGSSRIPEGVREAIGIRLNRLSEECNHVLRIAAVIGREFDFALLAAVNSDLPGDALPDLVEEAISASIVRETSGPLERYEFTHALTQQTLVEELSSRQRTRLHARIVDAIELLHGDHLEDHSAELAYYCAQAGTAVPAVKEARYARIAGEQSAARYAWLEARVYFEQALDALEGDAPAAERAAILSGLGRSELLSLTYPEIQRGWDNVARAFDMYADLGDSEAAINVAKRSAGYRAMWVNGAAAVYSRALALAVPGSVDAGHLLEQYADAVRFEQSDAAGSAQALEQALEIARRTGDRRLEFRVLVSLGWARVADGQFRDAIDLYLKSLELARKADQPVEEMISRRWLAAVLVNIGDADAALMHLNAALSLNERSGTKSIVSLHQFRLALLRGDLAAADMHSEVVESEHPGDSVIRMMTGIGAWHSNGLPDIDERFEVAHEEGQIAPSLWQRSGNSAVLAVAAYVMDRPHVAIHAGERARSFLLEPRLAPEIERSARITAGIAAIVAGEAAGAVEQYQFLKRQPGNMAGMGSLFSGDRLLGLLAHTAGMPEEAAAHFEDAFEFASRAGYRLETAWICHDYAETLVNTGDPSNPSARSTRSTSSGQARSGQASSGKQAGSGRGVEKALSLIDDGLEIAREIGSGALERRLLKLQERAASVVAPSPANPHGLTDREVEVLHLLSAGRTNREIAGELVLSARTVERHIANLYTKIDVRNRAEATSFALTKLAAPPTS